MEQRMSQPTSAALYPPPPPPSAGEDDGGVGGRYSGFPSAH